MENVTGRSTARRIKRATKNNRRETADLGQVLRMTPDKESRETLAAATALQRARAAALQKDRDAALATTRPPRLRGHFSERAALGASAFKFQSNPPVAWTPESQPVDTDADDESSEDEEEHYTRDEDTKEDDEAKQYDEPEATAIAAAEDEADSEIETPLSGRNSGPTQSDLDFIATDDDDDGYYDDDADYYPSTAEDNDEEEEKLLSELLQSVNLTDPFRPDWWGRTCQKVI